MNRSAISISLTLLSLLALADRLAVDVHFKAWNSPNAMEHKSIGAALAAGRGFTFGDWGYYGPTSVQSPPFPLLVGGLFRIFHAVSISTDGKESLVLNPAAAAKAYFCVLLLNAIAGAALVWLTYGAARAIGVRATAAVIAAGLTAVWPTQVYAARAVQAISLITCGLAAMTILYYRATRDGGLGAWVAFSFVAALTALTEPVFLPAVALSVVLVLFFTRLDWNLRIRNAAVLAFVVVAVIGPWTLRNYVVHERLIPVKGSFWVNVWKGSNDSASGSDRLALTPAQRMRAWKQNGTMGSDDVSDSPHQYDMVTFEQRLQLGNKPEAVREEFWKRYAMQWIGEHPARFVQLCGIRFAKSLTIDWDNPRSYNLIYGGSRMLVVVMTLAGLVVAWKQKWSLLFPAVVFGTSLISWTLTLTAARFAFPFEPFQFMFGGAALMAVIPNRSTTEESARGFEPLSVPGR